MAHISSSHGAHIIEVIAHIESSHGTHIITHFFVWNKSRHTCTCGPITRLKESWHTHARLTNFCIKMGQCYIRMSTATHLTVSWHTHPRVTTSFTRTSHGSFTSDLNIGHFLDLVALNIGHYTYTRFRFSGSKYRSLLNEPWLVRVNCGCTCWHERVQPQLNESSHTHAHVSFSTQEPLNIGHFCRKWRIKMSHETHTPESWPPSYESHTAHITQCSHTSYSHSWMSHGTHTHTSYPPTHE